MREQEPLWLSRQAIGVMHFELVAEHGGRQGVRSELMIEAALARPLKKWTAGERDPFMLAAAYAFGFARNRGFADGNKRIALAAALVFLAQNSIHAVVSGTQIVPLIIGIESGSDTEAEFADLLRARSQSVDAG